jgi:hypothetical protein
MKKFLIFSILILFFTTISWSANPWVQATGTTTNNGSYTWQNECLNNGNISLVYKTSGGSVNIAIAVYEDSWEVPTLSITSTTAETVKYVAGHGMNKIKVVWTRTSGTIDYIKLRCNS